MRRDTLRLLALLLPAGIFFAAFFLLPMVRLFLIGGSGKLGWSAYATIVTNANYFSSLVATLAVAAATTAATLVIRSEEHTSELQSLMRISSAVFCLKKK